MTLPSAVSIGRPVWCVLVEREVSAHPVIVREVAGQGAAQVLFAKHDDMIETLAPNRADKPLRAGVLPRAVRGREDFLDPHALHSVPKLFAVDLVAVAQEIGGRGVVRKGMSAGRSFGEGHLVPRTAGLTRAHRVAVASGIEHNPGAVAHRREVREGRDARPRSDEFRGSIKAMTRIVSNWLGRWCESRFLRLVMLGVLLVGLVSCSASSNVPVSATEWRIPSYVRPEPIRPTQDVTDDYRILYRKELPEAKSLVVLVHGWAGNISSTWGAIPQILSGSSGDSGPLEWTKTVNVLLYGYPTVKGGRELDRQARVFLSEVKLAKRVRVSISWPTAWVHCLLCEL
jgi:hypothetical protein